MTTNADSQSTALSSVKIKLAVILIFAGLLCGFVINVGAPASAFVWAGLRVERIVWTPNTGFTLYVDFNWYAISNRPRMNVSQIWVDKVPVSVTSPKLPCTVDSEYLTFVVSFPYTNGTSYDISVWLAGTPITNTFQGGTNWTAPSSSPSYSSLYLPMLIVTVAPVATLVGSFVLKKKLAITKHMKVVKTVALTFMVVQLANLLIEYSLTHQYSWFYENYVYLFESYGFLEGISLLAGFGLLQMLIMCIAIFSYQNIRSESGKRTLRDSLDVIVPLIIMMGSLAFSYNNISMIPGFIGMYLILAGVMLLFAGPLSMDMKAVLYTFIVVQLANFLVEIWLATSLPLVFA